MTERQTDMFKYFKRLPRETLRIFLRERKFRQSFNLLKYRLSAKSEALHYKPIYLTILPIHRCNLSCRMCLTHSKELGEHPFRHHPFPDMTFEMFRDITERFPEAVAAGFMGNGEPLLNKDIFRMIEHAESKARMKTALISNGIILEDFIEPILRSRLGEISISVNGHTPEEFERMTGMQGSLLHKIAASSKGLIGGRNRTGSDLKVSGSVIIDSVNLHHMGDMIRFAEGLGFDHLALYNILPLTRQRAKAISLHDSSEVIGVIDKARSIATRMTLALPIPLDGREKNNLCEDFFTSINIDGAGNVGGCNRQRFDIHDKGKYWDEDVWNNEYFRRERKKFLDKDLELDEPCKVCFANSTHIKDYMERSDIE